MTEEIQEIERLIKQGAELGDSLIHLARKLQEQHRHQMQNCDERSGNLGALHETLLRKRTFLIHLASTAKTSDFRGLNCCKSRPKFYDAKTLPLLRICNMRIGYARVSTDDQTLDLQRDALERAKCRKIYEEHASGKNTTRPELEACLKSLQTGDTLVVWRLDRLGRSLGNLIQLTNELQSRRVDLESLTEKLDTGSPTGKLVFHVFAALAEFERNLIRELTLAGLKAARARGRKGGRPKKLQAKELKTIRALLKTAQISVQEIATRFGVSRSTLYRNKLA